MPGSLSYCYPHFCHSVHNLTHTLHGSYNQLLCVRVCCFCAASAKHWVAAVAACHNKAAAIIKAEAVPIARSNQNILHTQQVARIGRANRSFFWLCAHRAFSKARGAPFSSWLCFHDSPHLANAPSLAGHCLVACTVQVVG